MTNITLSNLSTKTLDKLNTLAQLHGRSLQEEIQYILETVVEAQPLFESHKVEPIQEQATRMQKQLEHHAQLTSLQSEHSINQSLNLSATFER
jgi:plasmid stability protein